MTKIFKLMAVTLLVVAQAARGQDLAEHGVEARPEAKAADAAAAFSEYRDIFCRPDGHPTDSAAQILILHNTYATRSHADPLDEIAKRWALDYRAAVLERKKQLYSRNFSSSVPRWQAFFSKLGIAGDRYNKIGSAAQEEAVPEIEAFGRVVREALVSSNPSDCVEEGSFFSKTKKCSSVIVRFKNGDEINIGSKVPLTGDNKTSDVTIAQRKVYAKGPSGEAMLCLRN